MRTDPYENIKRWLHRYGELQSDADRLWDRAGELRSRIADARSTNLDGMPHGSSVDADRIGADLAHLEEIEAEAREAQEAATAARREIASAIKQICGPRWADRREVLRLRYLDFLRWEDAAERLFGDSQDFWDRQEAYLRRMFKLHRAALEDLAQIVPLKPGQENNSQEDTENDRKNCGGKSGAAGL